MPNVSIPLVGETYTSRSLDVSSQVTRGFYVEANRDGDIIALQPFPGLKLFAAAGTGANRGMGALDGVLYTVSGDELYSVSELGVAALIGKIPGVAQCHLEESTDHLVITNKLNKPMTYDGTALVTGVDSDLTNSATSAYINRRVVYDGNNRDLIFPDLDEPLVVQSANVISVDVTTDNSLAVIAKDQQLFAFTEGSIVPYYNSGVGSPPYSVIQNATSTSLGLGAVDSLAANKDYIYFLGSDFRVYRIAGLQVQSIGNPAIGQKILSYPDPSTARGSCFSFDDQEFYLITFPGQESWLFNERGGWTNLSSGVDGGATVINDFKYIYGKNIAADSTNGNLYELDFDTFDDNGATIIRQRDTREISGRDFGFPGKEIFMERLEIVIETGVGLLTGQGSDPQIMMQYSDDSGKTWSSERWKALGVLGDYKHRNPIQWFDLGSFYKRMFRFRVSDPVKVVFISANADIEVSGG